MKMVLNANPCHKVAVVSATKMLSTSLGWSVESCWISYLRSVILPFASPTIFVDSWNSKGVWLRAHLCPEKKKTQNVGTWWHPAQIAINKPMILQKHISINFLYLIDVHIYFKHFGVKTYWINISFYLLRSQDRLRLQQPPEGGHTPTQDCPRRKPGRKLTKWTLIWLNDN